MANSSEARPFSPIADTGGIQDEFNPDKFVEENLVELTPEEAKEFKYNEWRKMGHDFLMTKSLSERYAQNITRLDNEIAAAGTFGENIDKQYIEDPAKMPGWDKLGPEEQKGIINFAKLVQDRDKLSYQQEYLLQHEQKLLDKLKKEFDLSETDVQYELDMHNDSEVSETDLDALSKSLERILPKKAEQAAA
jgi:hypothetical protein